MRVSVRSVPVWQRWKPSNHGPNLHRREAGRDCCTNFPVLFLSNIIHDSYFIKKVLASSSMHRYCLALLQNEWTPLLDKRKFSITRYFGLRFYCSCIFSKPDWTFWCRLTKVNLVLNLNWVLIVSSEILAHYSRRRYFCNNSQRSQILFLQIIRWLYGALPILQDISVIKMQF